MTKERSILFIKLLNDAPPRNYSLTLSETQFKIIEHSIAWRFDVASNLIMDYDGNVDAIVLSGISPVAKVGRVEAVHRPSQALLNKVRSSYAYTGDYIEDFFEQWTIRKMLTTRPNFFQDRKVLLHTALFSACAAEIQAAGGIISGADALTLARLPILLRGQAALKQFLHYSSPLLTRLPLSINDPLTLKAGGRYQQKLRQWIKQHDTFVTFDGLIDQVGDLGILRGKTLIIDTLRDGIRKKITDAGIAHVLEFKPRSGQFKKLREYPFALIGGLLDQLRMAEQPDVDFKTFAIRMLEETRIKPNTMVDHKPFIERCGFVLHPLSDGDLIRSPNLKWLTYAPARLNKHLINIAAYMPPFRYGTIKGIKSLHSGREIECRLYALTATPKNLLSMGQELAYGLILKAVRMAEEDGCGLVGLGAYTKVVGDSGITIARRAGVPITNGNSYSAAATVSAALEMVKRLGFVTKEPSNDRLNAKAMIVGATGSIGRVCTLLLAKHVTEMTLVAPRLDKLIELRDEVRKFVGSDVKLKVAVNTDDEIRNRDLIVTASSNQIGKVLNIDHVKPGAVICDCSRPVDISEDDAKRRPDVLVIESGEIDLPGVLEFDADIGLPKPSVYACLAESVILALEERYENFSLGRNLSLSKVEEIEQLGLKHGAKLSAIRGPLGFINDQRIRECADLAKEVLGRTGSNEKRSA